MHKLQTKLTAFFLQELLKSNSGNFLVCPLSVDVVLALVHAGAKGSTAKQLTDGLQLPETPELVQQTFSALAPKLQGNEYYNLSSANKIYVKDTFQISDSYKTTAVNVFNAEIDNIDFIKNEEAAKTMNSWVEQQTHDKIHDLISKDDLDEDTRLVLINAMYFHGNWESKFHDYATRKRDFYLNNNDKVEIDMMEQTNSYRYYESKELNAKFLQMPYKGGDISMTIVLPNDKEGLGALEAKIEEVLVQPAYTFERVHVVLPKFKIETTIKFNPILQNVSLRVSIRSYFIFQFYYSWELSTPLEMVPTSPALVPTKNLWRSAKLSKKLSSKSKKKEPPLLQLPLVSVCFNIY